MTKRFLKLPAVEIESALSRSQIYRLAKEGKFPSPVKISDRSSAWVEEEIQQWKKDRIEASRNNGEAL